jgi:signal transduction histidine kinase
MELLSNFNQMIIKSYVKTTLICLCLSAILSLVPVFIMIGCRNTSCEYINVIDYGPSIQGKINSNLWLIAIITTIPMVVDLVFDMSSYICCREMRDFGIYRILLVIILVIPNIIMYYTVKSNNDGIVMRAFQYSLTYIQVTSLFAVVLVSLFCSKWKSSDEAYKDLKTRLSNFIMYFLVTLVISRLFFVTRVIFLGNYPSFILLSEIVSVGNTALAYYCIVSIVVYDIKFYLNGKLTVISFNMLSDILHVVAIIVHGIGFVVILVYNNDSYFYILYSQMALTLSLTIIPSQINLLRAEAKGNKVTIKLNTIRYVSHEMRTPLNISILGTKVALDTLTELSRRLSIMNIPIVSAIQIIESISKTVKELADMCNIAVSTLDDVLTFDKLDEKKLILEKQITCPLEIIREVINQFENTANALKIELRVACLPEDSLSWLNEIEFSCDRAKIIQILRYLLSNAIKYTPSKGRITVFLESHYEENPDYSNIPDARMIRISVKDTGRGISREKQNSIFTQFVETDSCDSSGLGLWICKSKYFVSVGI